MRVCVLIVVSGQKQKQILKDNQSGLSHGGFNPRKSILIISLENEQTRLSKKQNSCSCSV